VLREGNRVGIYGTRMALGSTNLGKDFPSDGKIVGSRQGGSAELGRRPGRPKRGSRAALNVVSPAILAAVRTSARFPLIAIHESSTLWPGLSPDWLRSCGVSSRLFWLRDIRLEGRAESPFATSDWGADVSRFVCDASAPCARPNGWSRRTASAVVVLPLTSHHRNVSDVRPRGRAVLKGRHRRET